MASLEQQSEMESDKDEINLPAFPFTVRYNRAPEPGTTHGLTNLKLYTAVEAHIQLPSGELEIRLQDSYEFYPLTLFDHWERFSVN